MINKSLLWMALLSALCPVGAVAECHPRIPSNIDASRYQLLADDIVEDKTTGLQWLRCPLGFAWMQEDAACVEVDGEPQVFSWSDALNLAAQRSDGWRLPNSKELESLVKRDCYNPAIEVAVFSNLTTGFVWSSTPASAYVGNAWAVQFRDGGVVSVDKEGAYSVRLVRNAP